MEPSVGHRSRSVIRPPPARCRLVTWGLPERCVAVTCETEPEQVVGADPELLDPVGAGRTDPVESPGDDQVIEDRLTDIPGEPAIGDDVSGPEPRP
jgi:hypothetical protein